MRNFKAEIFEREIRNLMFSEKSKSVEKIGEAALRAIEEMRKDKLKQIILTNHIARNTAYPVNIYDIKVAEDDLSDGYKRTLHIYSYAGEEVVTIFEQNFFAGFGLLCEGRGYIGILGE